MKNYTIQAIEEMTRDEAESMAEEKLTVKGYDVFLVDFSGYFGYSAVVFYGGKQIYHANDYASHHPNKSREQLRAFYAEALNNKLFTADELSTINGYDDYRDKNYYIRNYHSLREKGISIWFIGTDAERERRHKAMKGMTFSPISFAYYSDAGFVSELAELMQTLETARAKLDNDFEYQKSAFLYEMFNHEYGINWQADYDVISVFADIRSVREYENLDNLFIAADFSDLQKRAYIAARCEYFNRANVF